MCDKAYRSPQISELHDVDVELLLTLAHTYLQLVPPARIIPLDMTLFIHLNAWPQEPVYVAVLQGYGGWGLTRQERK